MIPLLQLYPRHRAPGRSRCAACQRRQTTDRRQRTDWWGRHRPTRQRISRAAPDAGTTLAELIMVCLIGTVVLGLVTTVTVSMAQADGQNLARQQRVDGVRQISQWLGDALTYASAPNAAGTGQPATPAFAEATAKKMRFYSALAVTALQDSGKDSKNVLSEVTIVLGQDCGGKPAPGVLYRCVRQPLEDPPNSGTWRYCNPGEAACPPELFEEFLLARDVVETKEGIFTYYLEGGKAATLVNSASERLSIQAVELRVTVAGAENAADAVSATVVKRFTVSEWRNL